jgi:hypothetical protein
MARHIEWALQVELAAQLRKWLPDDAQFTALDGVARDRTSGAMRRLRGFAAGWPDCLILCGHTKPIALELKAPDGRIEPSQRAMRERLVKAGVVWWQACSVNGAMVAIAESGLRFRKIVNKRGKVERWQMPQLEPYEVPRRDPDEKRPAHPRALEQGRERLRRWRARRRAAAGTEAQAN